MQQDSNMSRYTEHRKSTWLVLASSQVGTMSIMGKARNVNATSRAKASSQSASRLVIGFSEAAGHLGTGSIEFLFLHTTMALYIRMISVSCCRVSR